MKKQYRVKKNKDIEQILKEKKSVSNSCFIIYSKKTDETNHFRYAISVNKKIGNAVVRNRLKRQVRVLVREFNLINGVDFFIIVRKKALELEFDKLHIEMNYLFHKLNLLQKGEKND